MRRFGYARISTTDQTTENQRHAMNENGLIVEPYRWFSEQASGGIPAMQRPEFSRMVERMEAGDELVVLKLDRLGRDVLDVLATIDLLRLRGISVRSMDLDGVDLTSGTGRLQMTVMAAVAEFEKNRIRERTLEGLARAKAQGKRGGRPPAKSTTKRVIECKNRGLTQRSTSEELQISLSTVKRHWKQ